MGTLTITKSYTAGDPLMEVDVDAYRTGLLTLFNTDKFGALNFSGSTDCVASKFVGTQIIQADNTFISFGQSTDAYFGIDSSKNLMWKTTTTATEMRFYAGSTYYMEFGADQLKVPGDIYIGEGGASISLLQILSQYKKPVLTYNNSTSVILQQNSSTTDKTVIVFPTFMAAVTEASPSKYRYASISGTANGYGTSDVGAAAGGRRSGVSLTTNSWYYVYAVKLRSGSDYSATTAKFIILFDTTAPTSGSTLNTNYGAGNYVYLGMVRYGFGSTGSSSSIIPFKQSNKGWCSFYQASTSGYGGLNLTYTTTDADNTASALYTIAAGTSGAVIPATISTCRFNFVRERASDWYVKDSSGDVVWQGGWQDDDGTMPHGHMVELPNDTGYGVYQLRKSSNAGTAKAVVLAGYCDPYISVRQMGHGI